MFTALQEPIAAHAEAQDVEFAIVIRIGNGDRRQAIECPRGYAPMKHAVSRGPLSRRGAVWLDAKRRSVIVIAPLDHTPIHQASADAGTKQHGYPAHLAEFNFVVAEANVAEATKGEPNEKSNRSNGGEQIQDSELL